MRHVNYIEPEGVVQTGKPIDDMWVDDETCLLIPTWNYDLLKIFKTTIIDAFKRQCGYMRHCQICAEPFPYFPHALYEITHCTNPDCENQYWAMIEEQKNKEIEVESIAEVSPAKRPRKVRIPKEYPASGDRSGFIYLVQAENGLCKIGRAKDVEARRAGIERDIPIKIIILHSFASKDYIKVERYLHNQYADRRIKYEWFNLDGTQISQIRAIGDYDLDDQS